MRARETLRVAWWNTGLSPRRSRSEAIADARWATAEEVVEKLLVEARADLVILGELSSAVAEKLQKKLERDRQTRAWHGVESAARRLDVAILYNGTKLDVLDVKPLVDIEKGSAAVRQAHILLRERATRVAIHVFAVHWPSRLVASQARDRSRLGHDLRREVRGLSSGAETPYVVLIGDFNDEPFDPAICDSLNGSRDGPWCVEARTCSTTRPGVCSARARRCGKNHMGGSAQALASTPRASPAAGSRSIKSLSRPPS
jgi:hypothetical protein